MTHQTPMSNAVGNEKKKTVVAFATAWGPRHGGINALNASFLEALAEVALGADVLCVVPRATPEQLSDALSRGVELVIPSEANSGILSAETLASVHRRLRERPGYPDSFFWVGHDLITGQSATTLKECAGGGSAIVIVHSSYDDYAAVKHLDAHQATEKHRRQKKLFEVADILFAIGPLIEARLRDQLPTRPVNMLVPGLSIVNPARATSRLSAIAFGRLDLENDRIKQGRLAAVAFGRAIAHVKRTPGLGDSIFDNATLKLLGLEDDAKVRETILGAVEKEARRALDIRLLPYIEDRDVFLQEFEGVNLSLFLSWHEGFGLSAWEAIGAGIPLIISQTTGVFKLLKEIGGLATGCVTQVDVRGSYGLESNKNFRPEDVRTVRDAIIGVGTDITARLKDADNLRRFLHQQEGLTWTSMARKFADALNIETIPSPTAVASLPTEIAEQVDRMLRDFDLGSFTRSLNAAKILLDTGRYDSALVELRALVLDGAPELACAEYNLLRGEVHLRLNEYAFARDFAQRAIDYLEKAKNWGLLLRGKGVLNTLSRDLGQYGEAVEIAESMLRLAQDHAPSHLAGIHRKLARSLALDRQWRRAVQEAEIAVRVAQQDQNIDEQAKAHLACGEAHRHGFVQPSAVDEYKAAISLAATHGDWDCFLWAALGLGDSYTLMNAQSDSRDVLGQVERLLAQPGRRFPIETLHFKLSIAVLDFMDGKIDLGAFEPILDGYARLGVNWPSGYVAELRSARRATEPKRM